MILKLRSTKEFHQKIQDRMKQNFELSCIKYVAIILFLIQFILIIISYSLDFTQFVVNI